MFKVTQYPHGTFSWAECNSTDASKAKPFYMALMGWEADEVPMGDGMFYTMFKKDGEHVAGFAQMQPDMQANGVPSHWLNHVTVGDVDALKDKVTELGGMVLAGPFDVFEEGRMMVAQDPTGAQFSLWQAKNHIGAGLVNTTGAMCWNELATHDVAKATEFYSKLFGWEIKPDSNDYNLIHNNGRMNGGLMELSPEWGDAPSNWAVYFTTDDIERDSEKAKTLGGSVMAGPMDAGQTGRFSVIADPAGAAFTLIQLNKPDTWVE